MNSIERVFDPAFDAADRFTDASTWESGGRLWPSNERQVLTCCRVVDETHDVKSFEFRAGDGLPVRFEPGQFLTVSADVNGQPVERCYTISSPPTRPWLLSITVKRVPGGVMSNWLHDNMKPGNTLQAYGPSGTFTPTGTRVAKSLYLSAGSGVTPLMSMTRASIDLGLDRDIAFVHSARTPADIVFRDELRRLAKLSPRLQLFFLCEGVGDELDWTGETGRLSLALLAKWIPDYAEREVFTCGPAGYMGAVRGILREGGHDPARYHQESFDIASDVVVQAAAPRSTLSFSMANGSGFYYLDDVSVDAVPEASSSPPKAELARCSASAFASAGMRTTSRIACCVFGGTSFPDRSTAPRTRITSSLKSISLHRNPNSSL